MENSRSLPLLTAFFFLLLMGAFSAATAGSPPSDSPADINPMRVAGAVLGKFAATLDIKAENATSILDGMSKCFEGDGLHKAVSKDDLRFPKTLLVLQWYARPVSPIAMMTNLSGSKTISVYFYNLKADDISYATASTKDSINRIHDCMAKLTAVTPVNIYGE